LQALVKCFVSVILSDRRSEAGRIAKRRRSRGRGATIDAPRCIRDVQYGSLMTPFAGVKVLSEVNERLMMMFGAGAD
jgi:hypothetical protein